jgi:hypothetical protein
MFIPDSDFSIPDPGVKKVSDPESGYATLKSAKNLRIFNQKNWH